MAENNLDPEIGRQNGLITKNTNLENNFIPVVEDSSCLNPAEKVGLFRLRFVGRDDLFAKRWESSDGERKGYFPACSHDREPGVCFRPAVKCNECNHLELMPISSLAIARHAKGEVTRHSTCSNFSSSTLNILIMGKGSYIQPAIYDHYSSMPCTGNQHRKHDHCYE